MKLRFLVLAGLLCACGEAPRPTSNLGAEWLGFYTYSGKVWSGGRELSAGNVPMTMTVVQSGNALRGHTSEVDAIKGPSRTLSALVEGHFTGTRTFRLVKTYGGEDKGLPDILITGTLSDDGSAIHAEWVQQGPPGLKGTLELRRR